MKLIGKLVAYPLLAVNIITALLLIFSCYGSMAAPIGRWPFASLSGLTFPFLYLFNFVFLVLWLLTWKKGALVPIVTILICLFPTLKYFPLHFLKADKVQDPYITIVTYNTEGFGMDDNKDWTTNNPVLKYTLDLNADIVFLQEASKDVMKKAAGEKKIKALYPHIQTAPGSSDMACFSKYPIINKETEISEYHQFIKNPTDSTHYKASKKVLKNLLESTSQRAGQARLIADRARSETAKYLIVCGDFNDTPLSYSYRVFNRFMNDAYAKSGVGMGITYHEHRLYYRIDHIFCSRNITPLYTWIDRIQKDSDHYPVISKIRLE